MSSNGQNPPHDRTCTCDVCYYVRWTGSSFPTNGVQRSAGAVNTSAAGQTPQAQVNQCDAADQFWETMPPAQETWRTWDHNAALRATFRLGPRPTYHPYSMELEIDNPPPPPTSHQQANVPTTPTARPGTQGNGSQPGVGGGSASNASPIPAPSRAQTQPAPNPMSRSNGRRSQDPRARTSSTHASYKSSNVREDARRRTAGGSSHRRQVPSRRRSASESSSGEDTPDS